MTRKGRPTKWTEYEYYRLLQYVIYRRGELGESVRCACRNISRSKQEPWPGLSAETLRRRFGEAERLWLLGQYNQPGNIPSGTLSGQIEPTGNAHLTMDSLTGDPDYSLSRVHAGTPIHYTATAQFTARSGTGTRDQARHCDLAFSKI
jgi:hypothetical protein